MSEARPVSFAFETLDIERQARAQAAAFIGGISIRSEASVELIDQPTNTETLLSHVQKARFGDEQADKMVAANARIATIEAIFKAGNITRVVSEVAPDGQAVQYGQTHRDVQKNSLLYRLESPRMRARTRAETANLFRIEAAVREGLLHDYAILVPSLYPDDMTSAEAGSAGFFTDTMTGVFQLSYLQDGKLVTESAFIAGRQSEQDERQDIRATKAMLSMLGLSSQALSVTEMLGKPVLIHKSMLENGVADIVRWYDAYVGGDTFFGLPKDVSGTKSYEEFAQYCAKREAGFEQTVQQVKEELVAVAAWLTTPESAIATLAELVKKHAVQRALEDSTIDVRAFGYQAARHIEEYRLYMSMGDRERAEQAAEQAHSTAQVTMCGIRSQSPQSQDDGGGDTDRKSDTGEQDTKITGKIRCINCRESVNAKDVIKPKSWCCPKCKYEVDVCTGKVIRKGVFKTNMENIDA